MKTTKLSMVIFSPTGSTQKVMHIIGNNLELETEELDISIEPQTRQFGPDELVMFGVPSYGGRVPELAVKRIAELKGDHTPAILLVSYGNRAYDDTFLELKNIVETAGFTVIAAAAAVAEHSIMHQYGAGRPDADDQKVLMKFAQKLRDKLAKMEKPISINVPGNPVYREYNGVPLKPAANDQLCTGCGLCASRCPARAIPEDHPAETDTKKCISCMRCISICPQQARSLNEVMLAAASQSLKEACSVRKENELFLN